MIEPLAPTAHTRVGPYQLLGLLGAGGMGEVYLARPDVVLPGDSSPGDPLAGLVALKTMRAGLDLDEGARIRFRREIAAAGAVSSPHSAALVGGDASGATPWLATDYVPGPSLAEAVSRTGPLPEPVVRAVGSGLARALADMHAVRVLHRDLKPGNVLLAADGPKVIDFGIAQTFEATQLTRTGVVVGTPGYISPEHVNGSRSLVPASDVFCLGAVLAYAACGRGPFDDSDMAAVIFRIARGEADLGGVPALLRPVITRCLSIGPEDRPSPNELAHLLLPGRFPVLFPWHDAMRGQFHAHEEAARERARAVPAAVRAHMPPPQPPAAPAPAPERGGRRGLRIALAAMAVTVCGALGVLLLPGLLNGEAAGGGSGATAGASGSPSASQPPVQEAATTVIPDADAGRTGDFGTRGANRAARPAGWKPWSVKSGTGDYGCALSGNTLVCSGKHGVTALNAATGAELWNVPEERSSTADTAGRSIAAVVDGTVYAFMREGLLGFRLTDGMEQWSAPMREGYLGTRAVYAGGVIYYVARTSGGDESQLVAQQVTGKDRPEKWSVEYKETAFTLLAADGRLVAVAKDIEVFDLKTGKRGPRIAQGDVSCREPVLKGHELLCLTQDGITVIDMSDTAERRTLAEGLIASHKPTVSDDGIVVVLAPEELHAFRLSDGSELWSDISDKWSDVFSGSVSVAGTQVLVCREGIVVGYDLNGRGDTAERDRKRLGGLAEGDARLIVVGDVLYLAFTDGTVVSGFGP